MTTLDELRERLEKAEGPDRELDARIWNALFNEGKEGALGRATEGMVWVCEIHFEQYGGFKVAPDYTSSLDATIALVEAKLPGVRRQMQMDYGGNFCYWLTPPDCMMSSAIHASEPIALLLALLSALEKESAE